MTNPNVIIIIGALIVIVAVSFIEGPVRTVCALAASTVSWYAAWFAWSTGAKDIAMLIAIIALLMFGIGVSEWTKAGLTTKKE